MLRTEGVAGLDEWQEAITWKGKSDGLMAINLRKRKRPAWTTVWGSLARKE